MNGHNTMGRYAFHIRMFENRKRSDWTTLENTQSQDLSILVLLVMILTIESHHAMAARRVFFHRRQKGWCCSHPISILLAVNQTSFTIYTHTTDEKGEIYY